MKNIKLCLFLLVVSVCSMSITVAQTPGRASIDAAGNVYDVNGKQIGRITTLGMITDVNGNKVANIDDQGCLVDTIANTNPPRIDKYHSFAKINSQALDQKWTVSTHANGLCKIKDKNGNTIVEAPRTFIKFAPCTINCLTPK